MKTVTDIDIDVADRDSALDGLQHIPASRLEKGDLKKHVVGVYFHDTPVDPLTKLASIPYKEAEERGYFKIDVLNLNIYKQVRDEAHLDALVQAEPMWELLDDEDIVNQLFHLNGHFDVIQANQPSNINQLAMVLAMIRPGKRHLVGKTWDEVEAEIWTPVPGDEYAFKHAHAVSYAMVVVVQMNLLLEQAMATGSTED